MPYAERTTVSADRTRGEIEALLARHGATAFLYARDDERRAQMIEFRLSGRRIRFILPMPDPAAREFARHSRGARSPEAARQLYDQAVRQRWRALLLVLKAKLEAVQSGIVTIEQEFLPHVLLPSGQTVGDWIAPQLSRVYATQQMPALLPGLEEPPAEVLALPAGDGR